MYKDILKNYRDNFNSIDDVVDFYARHGNLFTIKEKNEKHFELIFNRQYSSTLILPRITEDMIRFSPFFFIDDDNIVLDLYDVAMITYIDRFDFLKGKNNYKVKHHKLLKRDINALLKTIANVHPFTANNLTKIQNRVRVIKTYKTDDHGNKQYVESFGKALWDFYVPNSEEDIRKYSKLFNDPINVVNPERGIYCCLADTTYTGVGYHADKDSITSIFPKKSNLPERLRQHYTSNFLEPLVPEPDYLQHKDKPAEKGNALCVFLPIASEYNKPFGDNPPVGENTLLAGEILITEDLAKKRYYIRRTYMTTSLNVEILNEGSIVNPGDPIAYDTEGNADVTYDLKYENAEVETVSEMLGGYKITLKIVAELSVARLISDYGIKGVTHPRKDLGEIELPKETFPDEGRLPVQMVIGPNSLKSPVNGIRLSWLAMKIALNNLENIEITPDKITAEEVTRLTSDLKKVKWIYKGKEYEAYAGLISYGVTDLAKDCKTDRGVKVMPETLKYMYLSGNEHLTKVADLLVDSYTSNEDKWILKELLKLKANRPVEDDDAKLIWKHDDKNLVEVLNDAYFNITSWRNVTDRFEPNYQKDVLLHPMNEGFYIKFEDTYVRMPSSKLINYQTEIVHNSINYPSYLIHAMYFLLSLKLYAQGKANKKQVLRNVENYLANVDNMIFSKKAALATVVSPIVEGGNLKQLVSAFVPRGVTVILDRDLEAQIRDFKREYGKKPIYEIGVRNPVLWRFQVNPKEVWTFGRFGKYLKTLGLEVDDVILEDRALGSVLRNVIDTEYDMSDTDGDLYPVCAPLDSQIQDSLHAYVTGGGLEIFDYEHEWIRTYIKDESKIGEFENVELKPFLFHTVDRDWFGETFANAAIAKMKVGTSTVDLWKFHSAVEFEYIKGNVSREMMLRLLHLFSRICQDYVVRGIKHNSGGASGYSIYALNSMDEEAVLHDLTENIKANSDEAELFVKIAKQANKNIQSKILSRLPGGGISNVIAKYAQSLSIVDQDVKENLSYGRILKPYWTDLIKHQAIASASEDFEENYMTDDSIPIE